MRDADVATVAQVSAQLKQNETNLSYTRIVSPIDGVVVSRSYDVGQTVAASFQAPTLFMIAQDLTKMQVLTNIDEADVGRIRVGQVATFTVDAYPDQTFKGSVSQIRLSPQTVQNVVTYPVMLDVPNQDLKLKPGMTANVLVPVDERKRRAARPERGAPLPAGPGRRRGAREDERREGRRVHRDGRGSRPGDRGHRATDGPPGDARRPGRARRRRPGGALRGFARDSLRRGPGREGKAQGRHGQDAHHGREHDGHREPRPQGGRRDHRRPRHGAGERSGRRRARRRAATLLSGRGDVAQPVIAIENLTRVYTMGETEVRALDGVTIAVQPGEFLAVMGPSGSGKSTFMNIVGCLDRPTAGRYVLEGVDVSSLGRDARAEIRNDKIGFVFQNFNLLSRTSALENVELPLLYSKKSKLTDEEARARAMRCLERVGLKDRWDHTSAQLSGGQQQRVAIARSLVNEPAILLADEPTGNLDSKTSEEVMAIFQALNDEGKTVVLITHEPDIAQFARRIVTFRDGRVLSDVAVTDRRRAVAAGAKPA